MASLPLASKQWFAYDRLHLFEVRGKQTMLWVGHHGVDRICGSVHLHQTAGCWKKVMPFSRVYIEGPFDAHVVLQSSFPKHSMYAIYADHPKKPALA